MRRARRPSVQHGRVLAGLIGVLLLASIGTAAVRVTQASTSKPTPPGPPTSSVGVAATTTPHVTPAAPVAALGPAVSVPVTCRNDYLGYEVQLPAYVYGNPDSALLGPCEILDARRLNPGDDLTAGLVTAPVVFRRIAAPLQRLLEQDTPNLATHTTLVAGRPTVVVDNQLVTDDQSFSAGSHTYTYYVDLGSTVLVAQLLIAPVASESGYRGNKGTLDAIMSTLQLRPTSCHNSRTPKCGDFVWAHEVVDQPMSVTATADPATPHAGDPVTFTITAQDPDADLINCTPRYGDAAAETNPPATVPPPISLTDRLRIRSSPMADYGPWDPPAPVGGTVTLTFTHTYATATVYTASFDCTSSSSAATGAGYPEDPYASAARGHVTLPVSTGTGQ